MNHIQANDDAPRGAFSVRDFCQWAGIGRTAFYEELKTADFGDGDQSFRRT